MAEKRKAPAVQFFRESGPGLMVVCFLGRNVANRIFPLSSDSKGPSPPVTNLS
jgi:hypothetical protein